MKRIQLVLCFLIIVLAAFLWWRESPRAVTITLTSQGFVPATLRVREGETVTFRTTTGVSFWPASNTHPTHDLYPAFDPRRPLEPHESWSFRFAAGGLYRYHDHMRPNETGVIVVGDTSEIVTGRACELEASLSASLKRACWEDEIKEVVRDDGVEAAFDILESRYQTYPDYALVCHSIAHAIGKDAYALYVRNRTPFFTEKTRYCGYGFYHGFMEEMLKGSRNYEEGKAYCQSLEKIFSAKTRDAVGACLHGFGHGVVEDPDPRMFGNIEGIIAPGLKACRAIGDTGEQVDRCATGVFNGLAILMASRRAGLSLPTTDPYEVCVTQSDDVRLACVGEMNTIVWKLAGEDIQKAIQMPLSIASLLPRKQAMESVMGYYAYLAGKPVDQARVISACHTLPTDVRVACIRGFAAGLIEHSKPNEEHAAAIQFCMDGSLTQEEKIACTARISWLFRLHFDAPTVSALCQSVERVLQTYCERGE